MAGSITLTQMRDEVRYNMDNREATDIPDTYLTRYINWAYLHVCSPSVYRHQAMQATQTIPLVAGTFTYAVSANHDMIYGVANITDGYRLKPRDVRWFRERPRTGGGRPGIYVHYNNNLLVHSTPSTSDTGKSLVVDYWAIPTPLSANASVTVLTPIWDEIIILGAVWRGWRSLNRPDHAEIAKQDYGSMINEVTAVAKIEGEDWDHQAQPEIQHYQER